MGPGYVELSSMSIPVSSLKVFTYIEGTSYSWVASSSEYDFRLYYNGTSHRWAIYDYNHTGLPSQAGDYWWLYEANKASSYSSDLPVGKYIPATPNSSFIKGDIYITHKLGKLTRN